ncbi:type II toxin-antitoxin system VapC family toxin [Thiocapsa marina]|uniref:PilT domain-containing protein n=1 Tax=Thiocapsa marina 5811 TaxID=768671 RepID=F9UGU6_9GAMM|nr:PIN domain-containing protein [Thiocapsa marina]EGV16566.1 PilT domain-containing protein [Thiocapsa marina 5811]
MNATPKTLVDITVLMDALDNEQETDNASNLILSLAAKNHIQGFVCAAAIDPLHTELARSRGAAYARSALQRICSILTIAPVDAAVIDGAMGLGWRYLDDALTFESARRIGLDNLVTLNGPDFDHPSVHVQAPEEFVQSIQCKP